jgi:Relaxase/Mobilisation nuclease domain/Large polyvalent protein-associated domain 7
MIAKLIKGSGFRGALDYLFHGNEKSKNKSPEIVGSNMAGLTARQLAREFSALRKLRLTLGKAVCHISLSIPADDKKLPNQTWGEIAETFIQELGFTDCPFVAVKHNDTDHQHIHILASRIKINGDVVSDKNDFKRAEDIIRKLEKKFGLSAVLPSNQAPKKRGKRFKNEKDLNMNKTNEVTTAIDQALDEAKDLQAFIDCCNKQDITVKPYIEGGKVIGTTYIYDGIHYKASSLGKEYQWPSIAEKYNHDREFIHLGVLGKIQKQKNIFDNQAYHPDMTTEELKDARRDAVDPEYLEKVWDLFKDEIQEAKFHKNSLIISFSNGGRLVDTGDRIFARDMTDKEAAEHIVKLAKMKGWQKISFKGNDNFIGLAMEEALKKNIEVIASNEVQSKILAMVKQKLEQEQAELTLTPQEPASINDGESKSSLSIQDAKDRLNGKRALEDNTFGDDRPKAANKPNQRKAV